MDARAGRAGLVARRCTDQPGLRALAAAAAGGTGAVATTALFYPIELVKNRLQSAVSGDGGFAYSSLADGLVSTLREDGIAGLFNGIWPMILRALASDFMTIWLGELLVRCCGQNIAELPLRIVGGWGSVAVTLPLETVSVKVTCARPRMSVWAAILDLWRAEGVLAFWRGFHVMLVLCVNPALTFTAFEWLRAFWAAAGRAPGRQQAKTAPLQSWIEPFVLGAAAKLLTLSAVYPLIRAKFVLGRGSSNSTGLFQVLREVASKEGFRGLYKGLDAQLSKSLLSTALTLAIKERTEACWCALLLGSSQLCSKRTCVPEGEHEGSA